MKHFTIYHKLAVILFWLIIWQIISLGVPKLLFASPGDVLESLFFLLPKAYFWKSVFGTLSKITVGFFLSFLLGIGTAILAYYFPILNLLLSPMIQLMKAIPVASFIVAALIWISSENISVLISMFVAFPIIYQHTGDGLHGLNPELSELAVVFQIPLKKRILKLYLPQMQPYIFSSLKISIGMCWKAGIAGEIIGLPEYSIGNQLYLSKLYLNMPDLFAWTLVIICLSILFEYLFVALLFQSTL